MEVIYQYLLKFEIILFFIVLILLEFNRLIIIPFLINRFKNKIIKKIDQELKYLIIVKFKREIYKEFKSKKNKEEFLRKLEEILVYFLNKITIKYNKIFTLLNPFIEKIVKEFLENNKDIIEEKLDQYYYKIEKKKNLDKFLNKIYLLFKDLIEKNNKKIIRELKERVSYMMFWLNVYFMVIYLIGIVVLNLIYLTIY